MPAPVTLVWLHRDLRLKDHPALFVAAEKGAVVPVYLYCPKEEGFAAPGGAVRWWLHQSLMSFQESLKKHGAPLIIRMGTAALPLLKELIHQTGATAVFWNRRYEPDLRQRDQAIEGALRAEGIDVKIFPGDVLYEPGSVMNQSGKPFQVFTPFWNQCRELPPPRRPLPAISKLAAGPALTSDPLESLALLPSIDWAGGFRKAWSPGEAGAHRALKRLVDVVMDDYARTRDLPSVEGTSALSPHLHFGEISPREVWHAATDATYRKEIGWRDFAHHILFHFPHTVREPLRPEFKAFPWVKSRFLRDWQKGRTGYPIVDAGLRQLWHTGWMHNRVRMIVASFLVKDLLVSWQEGAAWFMDTLVDADLANNTFNWQWAGGCGADAAPYFRIFNPVLQGERFDPEGHYVRRWIPELQKVPDQWVHQPWKAPVKPYAPRVVDHDVARVHALDAFKAIGKRSPPLR